MGSSTTLHVPLNRVEGDLEIRVEVEDGVVVDAWSSGTMYRGLERILIGRDALDGLVITPRVCGICSTSHLAAAACALDDIFRAKPPPNAIITRNLSLTTEHLQNDVRHAFLLFAADFASPVYRSRPLYEEAVQRYEPYRGETVRQVVAETKEILEVIAILGGQWPHTSHMVPGGVTSLPNRADLLQCSQLIARYRRWYEKRILGCTLDRWCEVRSADALDAWLEESESHRNSDLGFFVRFARDVGLDKIGAGPGKFLSYGSLPIPPGSQVLPPRSNSHFVPAGIRLNGTTAPFAQESISEHVACSWYEDYEGGLHPFDGKTLPEYSENHEKKYSWAKAPRYDGQPMETSPLAEAMVSEHPLFLDLVRRNGPSALVREMARITRPAGLIPAMLTWCAEIERGGRFYAAPDRPVDGQGCGLIQASRGALGHWVKIRNNKIDHYQIITPTSWHASPRDSEGIRGPWEQALIGTPIRDTDNPIEAGHVVRSFDACLVCTVHLIRRGQRIGTSPFGGISRNG